MKRYFLGGVSILMICITLLGVGCAERQPYPSDTTEKLRVAGTIFPVYDLVRTVGGEYVDTTLILTPGTSPHVFEPTPSVLKNLTDTSIVFAVGLELDDWTDRLITAYPEIRKVTLDRDISLHLISEGTDEHDDHDEPEEEEHGEDHHGEFDPHYWLSPMNAIRMIRTIETELRALDPDHASEFAENAATLIREIEAKDIVWKEDITTLENRDLVTFHSAFGYFAEHFGLDIITTFEEFPEKEPTPQYLTRLTEEIREHDIRALYLEPQLSRRSLDAFAHDLGVAIGVLDPLGGVESRMSYIDLIEYNVRTIIDNTR